MKDFAAQARVARSRASRHANAIWAAAAALEAGTAQTCPFDAVAEPDLHRTFTDHVARMTKPKPPAAPSRPITTTSAAYAEQLGIEPRDDEGDVE